MEIEILLNGLFKSCTIFNDFSNIFKCKVVPTSIGGNQLCRKYYEKFDKILFNSDEKNNISRKYSDVKLLGGNLFVVLLNHHVDTYSKSYYYLSIIKVCLKIQEKDDFFSVTPLESHTVTASSLDELELKYESFKKCSENGFEENFFGRMKVDCNSNDIIDTINGYTLDNDLKSLVCNDLDGFLFDIWSSVGTSPYHEWASLNSEEADKSYKSLYLTNKGIELTGSVLEYLSSDVMVLPNHLKSAKFSHVEEYSELSEYSDSDSLEGSESVFDFSSGSFATFFNKVTETIKEFGGLALPYLNGSYLQDGSWIINNSTVCNDLRDVVLLLKGSTAWQNELVNTPVASEVRDKHELKLYLYKIPHFVKSVQFRLFVHEAQILLISQLFFNNVYDYLLKEEAFSELYEQIVKFYNHNLVRRLPKDVSKVVVDLYIINRTDEIYVTNVSPWYLNNENIFTWEEIQEYVTSERPFDHDESIKVTYFGSVAFAILLSNKLSRHKLYSFCSEDVEEFAKLSA
ncbi:uncharacterized protein TOT_040000293 [Theileria orientalis strain Shintoku]|uniref:Uncharacterized protein n=1 Tax=Theileria orientalis strain Shintoku TaxID=869250 RepID=J4C948_THEOR|nr:uncharacterized protein TOT_040000293 [Theileria orientalis strain Shintoku]PVC51337.1 hypothetical protein MACL_00001610 [Theileria orientalis]BAM41913.1 uncharacterized protein TOT_040000293 [Theileria orientalis strain Shintoku]|eukprot:XP_009692214.1 uncharacterized protein TOT_040000293 [Theileria orientalis strain Shintoku]